MEAPSLLLIPLDTWPLRRRTFCRNSLPIDAVPCPLAWPTILPERFRQIPRLMTSEIYLDLGARDYLPSMDSLAATASSRFE